MVDGLTRGHPRTITVVLATPSAGNAQRSPRLDHVELATSSRLASTRPADQPRPSSRILTERDLLARRPGLAASLRELGCVLSAAEDWQGLLEQADQLRADVVVVDLDAAHSFPQRSPAAMSGYRLVALLARRALRRRFALVVQTILDFSEIDDLMRQGVHMLVPPHTSDPDFACQIHTAARHFPSCAAGHEVRVQRALAATPSGACSYKQLETPEECPAVASAASAPPGTTRQVAEG